VKLIRLMMTVTGIGLLTSSCFSLQPMAGSAPVPGTRMAFAINDVGRIALGGSMGPELLRVEGNLQSKDGDDYFVNVRGVELLQGGFQTWAGETVRINSSYVSAVYEKKFSTVKTVGAVALVAGAVAVLASKGKLPFVPGEREQPPDDTIGTRRTPMPFPLPARPGLPPFLRSLNPPRSH
jgi:hypothetical protein